MGRPAIKPPVVFRTVVTIHNNGGPTAFAVAANDPYADRGFGIAGRGLCDKGWKIMWAVNSASCYADWKPPPVSRYVAPAILDAFSCPYPECGALAHQSWHQVFIWPYDKGGKPMTEVEDDFVDRINADRTMDVDDKRSMLEFLARVRSRRIQVEPGSNSDGHGRGVTNLNLCRCFSCGQFSVWNSATLIFPRIASPMTPNADMDEDIRNDFLEAAAVLDISPRGSAALLRLCVQKMSVQLGEKGKNINDDIGALVRKGLDVRIQQALDVVRVVGNSAVHPGQIDMRDNSATARKLFDLVNLIADTMISQPKAVEAMYQGLPAGQLKGITDRDERKP